jgi:hypothetical protein
MWANQPSDMCQHVMHAGLRHEAAVLPFELHVLEVAIGDVCALCTELVKELESSSHPALDALTKHVSFLLGERLTTTHTTCAGSSIKLSDGIFARISD